MATFYNDRKNKNNSNLNESNTREIISENNSYAENNSPRTRITSLETPYEGEDDDK